MQETQVRSLGQEDPLEKEMVIHSSILAWRIPWMEKPGRLQSTGSQRVGHNWVTSRTHSLTVSLCFVAQGIACPGARASTLRKGPRSQPVSWGVTERCAGWRCWFGHIIHRWYLESWAWRLPRWSSGWFRIPTAVGMGSIPSWGTHKAHRVAKGKNKIKYLGIYLPRRQKTCTQ